VSLLSIFGSLATIRTVPESRLRWLWIERFTVRIRRWPEGLASRSAACAFAWLQSSATGGEDVTLVEIKRHHYPKSTGLAWYPARVYDPCGFYWAGQPNERPWAV